MTKSLVALWFVATSYDPMAATFIKRANASTGEIAHTHYSYHDGESDFVKFQETQAAKRAMLQWHGPIHRVVGSAPSGTELVNS